MRFALIIGLAPRKLGSLEEFILGLAREAAKRSHDLDVFGLEPILPEIRSALESEGGSWNGIDALLDRPVRAIPRLRTYDAIQLNLFGISHSVALLAFAAWPVPIMYVDQFSKREMRRSLVARLRRQALRRVVRSRVRLAVGVSEFAREHAGELLGLGVDRTLTVLSGVNLRRFEFHPTRSEEGQPLTVLAVAHLIPEKGIDCLIEAVARLDSLQLRIIGDGPERDRLAELSRSLGVDHRTKFLGLRSDVDEFLAACDIFVHPATWTEAFGLTIAEAMAVGCPIVASRTGAIPELIEDARSGLLFTPGDASALADALDRLGREPALRRDLGASARRRAEELFDLDRCVETHVGLLELLARRQPVPSADAGAGDGRGGASWTG